MTARDAIIAKMRADGSPDILLRTFLHYFDQLASGATGLLGAEQLRPLPAIPDIEQLPSHAQAGAAAMPRTVVIKLNGGLGTSMGLERAKTLLPVRPGLSFLDVIARQILHLRRRLGSPLPLLLMNSYSTDADTMAALSAYPDLPAGQGDIPLRFLQHRVPKLRQADGQPVVWPADPAKEWCPPGHGDLYTALLTANILDRLLAQGFEYAFVSNSDNLGATLDLNILGYFASRQLPFLMEAADRTEADKKGGHVAAGQAGELLLREAAQCPAKEGADFQDIRKHRYFNTNNLWIHLPALKARLQSCAGILGLPLICNAKPVDPADKDSTPVYQLETALGAALAVFPHAGVLRVPRTRFAPVKTTEDLLALWSDCFVFDAAMNIQPNPDRRLGPLLVRLDPAYYRLIGDFQRRFPCGAPSLLACEFLEVRGDICFGRDVVLRGRVHLANDQSGQRRIENQTLC